MVYREDIPGKVCDKHVLVDFCLECNAVANEYCMKFAEEGKCKVEKRALVKLTQAELDSIAGVKSQGLDPFYYQDNYVYLTDNSGNDASFKGFNGNLNQNVSAPYIVATGHKKSDWDAYQKENEESSKPNEEGGQTGNGDSQNGGNGTQ